MANVKAVKRSEKAKQCSLDHVKALAWSCDEDGCGEDGCDEYCGLPSLRFTGQFSLDPPWDHGVGNGGIEGKEGDNRADPVPTPLQEAEAAVRSIAAKVKCSTCLCALPKTMFSNKQLKLKGKRRCHDCVFVFYNVINDRCGEQPSAVELLVAMHDLEALEALYKFHETIKFHDTKSAEASDVATATAIDAVASHMWNVIMRPALAIAEDCGEFRAEHVLVHTAAEMRPLATICFAMDRIVSKPARFLTSSYTAHGMRWYNDQAAVYRSDTLVTWASNTLRFSKQDCSFIPLFLATCARSSRAVAYQQVLRAVPLASLPPFGDHEDQAMQVLRSIINHQAWQLATVMVDQIAAWKGSSIKSHAYLMVLMVCHSMPAGQYTYSYNAKEAIGFLERLLADCQVSCAGVVGKALRDSCLDWRTKQHVLQCPVGDQAHVQRHPYRLALSCIQHNLRMSSIPDTLAMMTTFMDSAEAVRHFDPCEACMQDALVHMRQSCVDSEVTMQHYRNLLQLLVMPDQPQQPHQQLLSETNAATASTSASVSSAAAVSAASVHVTSLTSPAASSPRSLIAQSSLCDSSSPVPSSAPTAAAVQPVSDDAVTLPHEGDSDDDSERQLVQYLFGEVDAEEAVRVAKSAAARESGSSSCTSTSSAPPLAAAEPIALVAPCTDCTSLRMQLVGKDEEHRRHVQQVADRLRKRQQETAAALEDARREINVHQTVQQSMQELKQRVAALETKLQMDDQQHQASLQAALKSSDEFHRAWLECLKQVKDLESAREAQERALAMSESAREAQERALAMSLNTTASLKARCDELQPQQERAVGVAAASKPWHVRLDSLLQERPFDVLQEEQVETVIDQMTMFTTVARRELTKKLKANAASAQANAAAAQASAAEAQAMQDCRVCLELPRSIVFDPCGHLACCKACAVKTAICPLCRAAILKRRNAFV